MVELTKASGTNNSRDFDGAGYHVAGHS
jgi:hypothetical protein